VRTALESVVTPYVVMVDADCTYPLSQSTKILGMLKCGSDFVLAYRAVKEKGSMPFLNGIWNWCLSWVASILYGRRVSDVCTGMWGFRTESVRSLDLKSVGFTLEAEIYAKAVKQGYEIEELPVYYRRRVGRAKLRAVDGLKILWFLVKSKF